MKHNIIIIMTFIIMILGTALFAYYSSKNGSRKEANDRIKDEKLYSFMLGGVYFLHSYGGVKDVNDVLISLVHSKPGNKDFIKELHSVYTEYFIFPFKKEQAVDARQTLAEYWNMTDAASYKSGMERLLDHGHQEHLRQTIDKISAGQAAGEGEKEAFEFVRAHVSEFPKAGIKSWDIARYVNNVAVGYAAGYIDKAEGEAMLEKVPAIARRAYSDWDEYWKGFSLGRKYWGGDRENDPAFDNIIKEMQQCDYSIYKYMPF